MSGVVGSVMELWRFPVKSMRGETIERADFTAGGVLGDRAFALIDTETGKVASAKSVRNFPTLFDCEAAFVEAPQVGHGLPCVRITLGDGSVVMSDAGDADRALSAYFKREVKLASAAPADFTIEMSHPDAEGLGPEELRGAVVDQKLGASYFAQAGLNSPVSKGAFFDLFPASVLTSSTLKALSAIRTKSRFESPRFRMNLIVDTAEEGFVENNWVGHTLSVGRDLQLGIAVPDARCIMTTLAQGDLPKDTEVLRTIVEHNRLAVGPGQYPCAGVYAVVARPGAVRTGETVSLG